VPADFRCAHCEAEFPTWAELDEHVRSAHLTAESAAVRCPACGEPFASESALDAHEREAHDVPFDEEARR
jgi:DNA-directed RNA polymerase subunit RPC12/RpoP